jgi:hypothetical protein
MTDDDSVNRRCWIISIAMDDFWLLIGSCLSNSQLLAKSDTLWDRFSITLSIEHALLCFGFQTHPIWAGSLIASHHIRPLYYTIHCDSIRTQYFPIHRARTVEIPYGFYSSPLKKDVQISIMIMPVQGKTPPRSLDSTNPWRKASESVRSVRQMPKAIQNILSHQIQQLVRVRD